MLKCIASQHVKINTRLLLFIKPSIIDTHANNLWNIVLIWYSDKLRSRVHNGWVVAGGGGGWTIGGGGRRWPSIVAYWVKFDKRWSVMAACIWRCNYIPPRRDRHYLHRSNYHLELFHSDMDIKFVTCDCQTGRTLPFPWKNPTDVMQISKLMA